MAQRPTRQATDRFGPSLSVAGAVVNIAAGIFFPGLIPAIAAEAASRGIESVGRRADQEVQRTRALEHLGDVVHKLGVETQGIARIATDMGDRATRAGVNQPLPMTPEQAAMLRSRRRRLGQLLNTADRASLRAARHVGPNDIDELGPLLSELRKTIHNMNCEDAEGVSVGEKIQRVDKARQALDKAIRASL